MKKRLLSAFLVLVMLLCVLPVGSVSAAEAVEPIAELKPSAITEDISGINGYHDQTPVPITGSTGIVSLAGHAEGGNDGITVSLKEEGEDKFVRFTNTETCGTYSQFYINLDSAVFTGGDTYYFSLTFRLNDGYTCTDGSGRAVLARLVDNNQNNYTVVSKNDLTANDYTDWTTSEFSISVDQAPKVLRLIIFAD
ncbi:MAG: carbohydrate binding domain-containing protein, partial [Clostridia bacterium]|nr:carbohydrate binding domain-containing protein [Clostridia bacterium]